MKFATLAAAATALALAAAPAAVSAQAAAPTVQVTTGATVFGPQGGEVGRVVQVSNGVVVVDTGKHKAPLPVSAFGKAENGLSITVTKAQLNSMLDQQIAAANAKRDAALIAGAMVHSPNDAMLGTVKSIEGDAVILDREDGPVQLKREHFAVNAQGTLIALFTDAQLDAAAGAAAAGVGASAGAATEVEASAEATAELGQ